MKLKKYVAILLTLVMVLSMAVPAFAEGEDPKAPEAYSVTLKSNIGNQAVVKTYNQDGKTEQSKFEAGEKFILEAWTGSKSYNAKPIEICS